MRTALGSVLGGRPNGAWWIRRPCLYWILVSVACAARAEAQATSVTEPTNDYLVQVTQQWAAASPLSSLVKRDLAPDDIELRVWGGYGLTTTAGVILRRTSGHWQTWRAEVVPCTYSVPIPVGDTASAPTESLFVRRAHERCGAVLDSTARGYSVYSADTLKIAEVRTPNPEDLWQAVVKAGVLDLPTRIPRKWVMMDGFTYVIEVRVGGTYRVSVIEAIEKPEVDADRQARAIYDVVEQGVPQVTQWPR